MEGEDVRRAAGAPGSVLASSGEGAGTQAWLVAPIKMCLLMKHSRIPNKLPPEATARLGAVCGSEGW